MIKVYWNGLKTKGKLQKAYYYVMENQNIKVNAWEYSGFDLEIWERFKVVNNSDCQTDYFEKDSFIVPLGDPMYNDFLIAIAQRNERQKARIEKRLRK